MPQPALGRTVHVFVDPARNNGADVAPAVITRVWSEQTVNVRVLLDGTEVPWATSLTLWNDRESAEKTAAYTTAANGDHIPSGAFWPPTV